VSFPATSASVGLPFTERSSASFFPKWSCTRVLATSPPRALPYMAEEGNRGRSAHNGGRLNRRHSRGPPSETQLTNLCAYEGGVNQGFLRPRDLPVSPRVACHQTSARHRVPQRRSAYVLFFAQRASSQIAWATWVSQASRTPTRHGVERAQLDPTEMPTPPGKRFAQPAGYQRLPPRPLRYSTIRR